jgi:ribosomal protein L11 methyltransferase
MTWLQLRFTCDAATATRLAELLAERGALAVSLGDAQDQPVYEPQAGATPLWPNTRVSGLFPGAENPTQLLAALQRRLAPARLPAVDVEALHDQDWLSLHQDGFAPARFGDRLWVVPSWARTPRLAAGEASMTLDPGLAFGTGSHPTTAMCLDWLAAQNMDGIQAADYGCGSGILAVAAAKLGARRVWAVDNDPQALAATSANATANGVGARVKVRAPRKLPPLTVDLLVSNILANTLSELAQSLSLLLAPGGCLALSGILSEQSPAVVASFAPWCALQPVATRDDWVLLAGTRYANGA